MPRTWVYDPHSGGVKIPIAVRERTKNRILAHASKHYAGKYTRLGDAQRVRYWLETGQTLQMTAEAKSASKTSAKAKPVSYKHPAKRGAARA